jgi:ketol-acid reductoisomerase
MSENKVVYNIIDNGDYKSFDTKIDSILKRKFKNLLQRPKSGDFSNRMDKMEAKLCDLAKSLEQISSTTEEIRTEIKLKKQLN